MNKDTAKDYLPLVQALAEGKTIQHKPDFADVDRWVDVSNINCNYAASTYRIKPEQLENKLAIAEHLEQIALKMRSGDASAHNLSESIYQREGSFISEMKVTYECKTSKPEPKKQWCRMYLVKGVIGNSGECFYSAIALNGHIRELEDVEKSPIFVRWLTGRIEYTIPEGDA